MRTDPTNHVTSARIATVVHHSGDGDPPGAAPWRRALRLIAPAALLTLLVPTALLGFERPDGFHPVVATVYLVQSSLAVLAGLSILRPAVHMTGRPRLAWSVIGAGSLLWSVANTGWLLTVSQSNGHQDGAWIPAFTLTNTVLLAGAVLLPASKRRVAKIRRLDTAIMTVAALGLIWALPAWTLMEQISERGDPLVYGALAIAEVLTVLVAMGAIVRCRPDTHNEIRPLAASLILLGTADLISASGESGHVMVSRVADAFYTAALLLLFLAGRRLAGPPSVARHHPNERRHRLALPELVTVVALIGLAVHGQFITGSAIVPIAIGSLLVLLAIIRLGLLEHEQRQLTASMRSTAARLYSDARLDTLTGLGNRMALDERLERSLTRRRAQHGRALSVFFIDVDHFKRFNDGLGHHAGDLLLAELAQRFRDVLGEADVHRVGGDEFVAVRDGLERPIAELHATDVVGAARAPITIDGHELTCTVSVGLAHLTADEVEALRADRAGFADALLRRADLALYSAKERGRNQWAGYDPALQQDADERLRLQQQLHLAVDDDQLEVHYQPIADLRSRETVGLSAALRWRSDDHGLLEPRAFMPAVIDGGLLPQLNGLLFRDIVAMLHQVDAARRGIAWISTPLSREQIVHPGLVEAIIEALAIGRIDPRRVRIEITEDTVVHEAALDVIADLRELGVHLTVHHFGTGPSSLLSMGRYPASTIEVDGSFVEGIGRRRDDTVIVTAVAGLTADLGMELAADGVTEEFQAEMLRDLGCTLGQGRLFGDAVDRDQILSTTGPAAPR